MLYMKSLYSSAVRTAFRGKTHFVCRKGQVKLTFIALQLSISMKAVINVEDKCPLNLDKYHLELLFSLDTHNIEQQASLHGLNY